MDGLLTDHVQHVQHFISLTREPYCKSNARPVRAEGFLLEEFLLDEFLFHNTSVPFDNTSVPFLDEFLFNNMSVPFG